MKMLIDERIRESGYQKQYVAEKLGISKDTLTSWIKGKSYPKLNKAVELAELLGCKIDDLYTK